MLIEQGVAITGRNRTGPPCSVSLLTAHAAGPAVADCPRAWQPASPPAGSVTDDDRRQRAKQYWPIRRANRNMYQQHLTLSVIVDKPRFCKFGKCKKLHLFRIYISAMA